MIGHRRSEAACRPLRKAVGPCASLRVEPNFAYLAGRSAASIGPVAGGHSRTAVLPSTRSKDKPSRSQDLATRVVYAALQILKKPGVDEAGGQARVVAVRMAYVQQHESLGESDEHHAEGRAIPFLIPGFDLPRTHRTPCFAACGTSRTTREDIPDTPETREASTRFLARDRLLVETLAKVKKGENITARYVYDRRGDQNLRLIELHELLGNWKPFPLFSYEDTW